MSPELTLFASSRVALPFAMGAVAYIGVLHLWFATERDPAHRWVALWCAFGLAFQATRYAQLATDDPATAVRMSRLMVAVTPLLIWSVAGLSCSLARGAPIPRWLSYGLAPVLASSAVIALTPLMVSGQTYTRTDWFGREHLGVPGTPWVALLLPGIAATIWLAWNELSHSPQLGASQRRVLLATCSIYAGMGVLSVLTGLRWIPIPMVFEFGPLVVAIGLNYLLVDRHRRLQGDLSRLVDERTAEIDAARDRLERSEARYRSLMEQAPIGVVSIDPSGRLRSLNATLRRLLGVPPGEDVLSVQTLDHERLVESGISAAILHCLETGEPVADEFTFHAERAGKLRLRINLVATRDELGGISGVVGVADDVTERRVFERRLRQAQKMESVGVLAAGIAHEINNPMAYVRANLAHMRGSFETLRSLAEKSTPTPSESVLIEEWDELIDECQAGVQRVVSIVKDMREFSHAGDEDRVPVDLADVMRTSVRVATARCTEGRRIEQHYEPVEPVPCSPGPLRQVFVNLLVNALQAVGPDGIVRVEVCDEPGAILARVSDDGCGIARGDLHRLFDPFFTTKPTGEGTGLGLSISWQIVKLLGGEIRVHSEPGSGSAFEVRLPKPSVSPPSSSPAV